MEKRFLAILGAAVAGIVSVWSFVTASSIKDQVTKLRKENNILKTAIAKTAQEIDVEFIHVKHMISITARAIREEECKLISDVRQRILEMDINNELDKLLEALFPPYQVKKTVMRHLKLYKRDVDHHPIILDDDANDDDNTDDVSADSTDETLPLDADGSTSPDATKSPMPVTSPLPKPSPRYNLRPRV